MFLLFKNLFMIGQYVFGETGETDEIIRLLLVTNINDIHKLICESMQL